MADQEDDRSVVWRVQSGLAYRKLVDGGMIYDRRNRQVHHLNRTAAWIWEACRKGMSAEEIVEGLCRSFAVGSEEARRDVEEILEQFAEADLIQR